MQLQVKARCSYKSKPDAACCKVKARYSYKSKPDAATSQSQMQLVVKSKPDAATSQSQMQLQVKDNLANWLNFNVLNLCLISKKQSVAYGHQFSLFHKLQTLTHFAFSANLAVLSLNCQFQADTNSLWFRKLQIFTQFAFSASLAVLSENFVFWALV